MIEKKLDRKKKKLAGDTVSMVRGYTSVRVFLLTDKTISRRRVKRTQHMVLLWNFPNSDTTQRKPWSFVNMLIVAFHLCIKKKRKKDSEEILWMQLTLFYFSVIHPDVSLSLNIIFYHSAVELTERIDSDSFSIFYQQLWQ